MKRVLLSFLILPLFFVLSLQFNVVSASNLSGHLITSPITSFVTISGKAQLKFLGPLLSGIKRLLPAADIMMRAENIFTHEVFTTQTDTDGNYTFQVTEGIYEVTPHFEDPADIAVPPLRIVNAKTNKSGVNFKGLVLPEF